MRPWRFLTKSQGLGPRPRTPLPLEHASLSSTPSADFCNRIRRADTPYELSIPTREQGFHPAARRHWKVPVALASWCVAAPGAGGPRSAPRRLSPPRSTCVDGAVHGPELSSKGGRTLLTMCVYPSRGAPGTRVASSNRARPGEPDVSSHRPRLFWDATSRKAAASRESRCLPSRQNPYVSEGLLPRARLDRGSVTLPPVEALLGSSRAFVTACVVPSSDEESTCSRLDLPAVRRSALFDLSQHLSRLLRTNQLAGTCAANFMRGISYESHVRATKISLKVRFFSPHFVHKSFPQVAHVLHLAGLSAAGLLTRDRVDCQNIELTISRMNRDIGRDPVNHPG